MHTEAVIPLASLASLAPRSLGWWSYAAVFLRRRGALFPVVDHLLKAYGPSVRVRFGVQTVCLETQPETVQAILVDHAAYFEKNKATLDFRDLIGDGLLTAAGERWKYHRRLISPVFFRQSLRQIVELTKQQLPVEIALWQQRIAAHAPAGTPLTVDLPQFAHGIMLGLSAAGLFGVREPAVRELIAEVVSHFIERSSGSMLIGPIKKWLRRPAFQRLIRRMDTCIYGLIATRRASGVFGDDFLGSLLQLQQQEGVDKFSDQDIRDEAFTMLGASHDTLSTTLTWALFELAARPDWQQRLADEAGDAAPIATQVLQETMRLYPPAWIIGREATASVQLPGYSLHTGDTVLIPITCIHRDARNWPRPTEFAPDRFPLGETVPHSGKYLPFGLGPRACIGQGLALWQGRLILGSLLKAFHLERLDNAYPQPQFHIIMRPPSHLKIGLRLRSAAI